LENLVAAAAIVAAAVAAAMVVGDEANGEIGDWGYTFAD
jgi:hypothetical protein